MFTLSQLLKTGNQQTMSNYQGSHPQRKSAGLAMMRLEPHLPDGEAILQVEEGKDTGLLCAMIEPWLAPRNNVSLTLYALKAIALLDDNLKRCYNTARETVPDLVTTETDPRKFLQVSNGNVQKAAETIAFYWMYREHCFGERWLLPMTQTGTGCLSREDIEGLRSG
jgi:hypothetical protein